MTRSWLTRFRRLFYPWRLQTGHSSSSAKRRLSRLCIEPLEDRWLPSTFTVMDNSDSGSDSVSLRYLLANVPAGSTIDFAPSVRSITLTSNTTLTIGTNVNIVNDMGIGSVTISGNDNTIVFTVLGNTTATLSGLTIIDGAAPAVAFSGGGGIDNSGTLTVSASTFTHNSASNGFGGAIKNSGTLTVSASTFTDNSAVICGGIYNTGTLTVSASTFDDNNSGPVSGLGEGGGIVNTGMLAVTASTFTGNSAAFGGGIENDGTLTVSASTFDHNVASEGGGGGIDNPGAGTATLISDIVAGNAGGDLTGNNVTGSSSFNLIGTGGSDGLVNNQNGNQVGVSLANVGLAPLGNYGGPTQTLALLPGSFAIGKGITEPPNTTDQRGFAVPSSSPSDVGAFQSGPLVVNTTADSDSFGLLTLRDAIAIADADTTTTALPITFDPTVFASSQTITLTGGTLTLGGSSTLAPISISGPSAGVTISGDDSTTVFTVNGSTTATLSGLTITDGNDGAGYGGGISNSGTLTVNNSTIANDSASVGGGIVNYGTLTVSASTFADNSAYYQGGGGGIGNAGTLTVSASTFTGNSALGGFGGGIDNGGTLTVNDSILSDDSAAAGGGIFTNGSATISGSTLSVDSASYGGGIFNGNGNGGTLTVSNSTLAGDSATVGGALDNGNSVSFIEENGGSVTLNGVTVVENAAVTGGGLANDQGAITLNGSIVAGNSGGDLSGDSFNVSSSSFNLIGSDSTGSFVNDQNANLLNINLAQLNLAPLGYYGGPTQTIALLPGSLAIGHGSVGVTTDQRGFTTSGSTSIDAGAFQYQSSLVVNTTDDTSGADSPGLLTLRQAINLADADTTTTALPITFDSTVFASSQTITLTGGTLTLGGSSTIAPITITGPSAGVTISGADSTTVFTVNGSTTAMLSGLTIIDGNAAGGDGGGIHNDGTLTVIASTFADNSTPNDGGGILNFGMLTVSASTFVDNAAGGGGGIYNDGTLTVTNSLFSNDSASANGVGGGIDNDNGGTLTVSDSTFTNNAAGSSTAGGSGGGGIANFGTLTVNNTTFSGNYGGYDGGGIQNGSSGVATVSYSTFTDNSTQAGGGILNTGTLTVTNSFFGSDSASYEGGGIDNGAGSVVTVTNTTFADDTASYGGGFTNGSTATLTNVTLSANTATVDGGSIYNSDTLTLQGTLAAGNNAPANPDVDADNGGGVPSGGITANSANNLIGIASSDVGLTNGLNGNQVGVSLADTGLAPLGNYGGPTQTFALLPGSFALGKGITETTTTTDQRGFPRPVNSPSDVGAFEDQIAATAATAPAFTAGTTSGGTLANFTDSDPSAPTSSYTATINWGDGTAATAGTIVADGGDSFSVVAKHNYATPGVDTVTITLSDGDANARTVSLVVNPQVTTTTTVTSSANPSAFGQSVTFTATVTPSSGTFDNGGTVTFTVDGNQTTMSLSNDSVTLSLAHLSIGAHTITATYNGDTDFGSSSSPLSGGQIVNPATTSTTVTSSLNPSQFGQLVTFTAAIKPGSGAFDNGGTVQFAVDGTDYGAPVNLSNGSATIGDAALTAGSHTITALYSGDTDFGSSTGTLSGGQTILRAPVFTSGTPTDSVTAGQVYSFTFTASGNPSPTLTADNLPSWLTFNPATGVLSGSSTLAMTYDNLEVVAASSDGSATQTFNLTVNPAAASRFVVSAPGSATVDTYFGVTITAEDQFGNTATSYDGTVHFSSSDSQAVLPANSPLTNGTDTFTVTLKTAGNQTITATDSVTATLTGSSAPIAVSSTAIPIKPDRVAVFDPTTATWIVDNAATGDPSSSDLTFSFGAPGDTGIIGDWNGAGYDEIGVYRVDTAVTDPVSGKHPLIFSLNVSGTGVWNPAAGDQAFVFGLQGDTVVVGDWLGNGKDEIGVVRPGSDGLLVWSLNLSTGDPSDYAVYQFGLYSDKPIVGDWNGAGKTEIGTVRTAGSDLVWSLNVSGTGTWDPAAGDVMYTFGQAGDVPLVGEWSGGGTTEIGTYRVAPNGAELEFSLDTGGTGVFSIPPDQVDYFGAARDTTIVGDWNGSGKTEIGTYRLSATGQVLLSLDTNGDGVFDAGDEASQIGLPGGPNAQVFAGQWKNNS